MTSVIMPPSQTNVLTDSFIDYLTCGGCASEFPLQNITNFIQHKKVGCLDTSDLETSSISGLDGPDENALLCYTCSRDFMTARGLLQHIQLSHNLKVFLQPGEEQEQTPQQSQQTEQPTDTQTEHWTDSRVKNTNSQADLEQKSPNLGSRDSVSDKKARSDVVDIPQGHTVEITSGRRQSDKGHHDNDYEQSESTAGRTTICCNSQECCVTIIPGTHERPKKCCSAVVPKKRKQHMAEHMGANSGDQESSDDRESDQNEDTETQGEDSNSNSIFIDFHPQFQNFDQNSVKPDIKTDADTDISRDQSRENEMLPAGVVNERFDLSAVQEVTELGSLIMHPGKTYSIPVSYAYSVTDLQILNNRSIKIFPQTLDRGEKTGSFTVETSDASTMSSSKLFDTSVAEIQQKSVTSNLIVSESVPVTKTTAEPQKEGGESRGPAQEAEFDDSDKEDEMEIDESLADRGRKRRYPTSRPFKCSQCDHAFNQRIHLKKHMSKHTGVKPFKCAQCSYATVERSHLKVHIRIHTGEKPFKCTFCKYATAQNSTLKIHLKRHHNGKMLECEDCHKQFTQHEMLTNHRMGHQQSGLSSQPISVVGTSGDRGEPPDRSNRLPRLTSEPISSIQSRPEGTNQFQAVYEMTNQSVTFPSVSQSKT